MKTVCRRNTKYKTAAKYAPLPPPIPQKGLYSEKRFFTLRKKVAL